MIATVQRTRTKLIRDKAGRAAESEQVSTVWREEAVPLSMIREAMERVNAEHLEERVAAYRAALAEQLEERDAAWRVALNGHIANLEAQVNDELKAQGVDLIFTFGRIDK